MSQDSFQHRIYLDYASLTPIDKRVVKEVTKYSSSRYANPASLYAEGVLSTKILSQARKKVADFIHAHSDEIIFTSGGTEANGLALEGIMRSAYDRGITKPHIIISAIEHSSVIELAGMMEKHGCDVTRISVNELGVISLDELRKSLKENTILISIMTVNNEIGTIQPIREIAKLIRQFKKLKAKHSPYPLFHTDAAQAALYEDLFVEKMGVDLLTLDGTKIYGPRGIGCLYIKRGVPIQPIIYGGGQESGYRSGTENIPGIMGFAKALEIVEADKDKKKAKEKITALRNMMIAGLKKIKPNIKVNGDGVSSSAHILNISIPSIDSEFFIFQLDALGIACSTKSSCLRDESESYVLKAIGAKSQESVRFSFGRWTKKGDITRTLIAISKILSTSSL